MIGKNYVVYHKRGRLQVFVRSAVIELRGEHYAVADAAWKKLMGQNELGEDVDKRSTTRKILMTELLSNYEDRRVKVFEEFMSKIQYAVVAIVHRV